MADEYDEFGGMYGGGDNIGDGPDPYSTSYIGAVDTAIDTWFNGMTGAEHGTSDPSIDWTGGSQEASSGGFLSGLGKYFKDLDGKTQSVLASSAMAGLSAMFAHNYKADEVSLKSRELDIIQQNTDLKKQAQATALNATAQSYDPSKYKIPGVFNYAPVKGLIGSNRSST